MLSSENMKIAIVSPGLLPIPATRGGAVETLVDIFVDEFQKININDTIDIFSVSPDIEDQTVKKDNNVSYYTMKFKDYGNIFYGKVGEKIYDRLRYLPFLNFIKKHFKKENYDIVIIENRPEFVSHIRKFTKGKIFLHLHNDAYANNSHRYQNVVNECEGIIVVSKYIKSNILKVYGMQEDKVSVIHNGIDIERFSKNKYRNLYNQIREKYKIPQNAFVLCFAGRIQQEKGVLELVQAFKKVSKDKNMYLLIIGSSWFGKNNTNAYVQTVINEANDCKNKIIFTGYISNEEVAQIESIADIAVLPSMWDDPLPLVVIEAMASGLPVITTNLGGIPEMCTTQTGIIVDVDEKIVDNIASAIRSLFCDEKLRVSMANSGQIHVEKYFSKSRYFKDFYELIKK